MFDHEIEIHEWPVLVALEGRIYGDYRPATWGYYGGEPAEYPVVEDLTVTVISDSAEDEGLGGFAEGTDITHLLTRRELGALEDLFLKWTEEDAKWAEADYRASMMDY